MRRHSPYNYAFNNPVFFIDPDGMAPIGSLASYGFKDFSDSFAEVEGSESSESSETSNNAQSYSNYFGSVAESAAEGDVSLDGGKCPDGDCGGKGIWGKGSVSYNGKGIGRTNFLGPGPDINPFEIPDPNRPGEYLRPIDEIDKAGQTHDYMYWMAKTGGAKGALFNSEVIGADILLMATAKDIMQRYKVGGIDQVTNQPISERTYNLSRAVYYFFSLTITNKISPAGIRH